MKYIYLDSNFWIDLGDGIRNGFQNNAIQNFYYLLKELTYSGKAICPISNAVFLELFKQKIANERQSIASVMDELSKGITVQSKYYLFKEEILSLSKNIIYKPWKDITEFTTVLQELIIDTPEWKKRYAYTNSLPSITQLASTEIVGDIDTLEDISTHVTEYLQKNKIKHDNEAKDFRLMQTIEILHAFTAVFDIFPDLKNKVPDTLPQDIGPDIHSKMPSIWSFASIHSLLRNDTNRKYRVNDQFDIEHCSIALGYFDYLFTEKSFFHVVTHDLTKLDKRFNLVCAMKYDEVNEILSGLVNSA